MGKYLFLHILNNFWFFRKAVPLIQLFIAGTKLKPVPNRLQQKLMNMEIKLRKDPCFRTIIDV